MCLAIPGKIKSVDKKINIALVDFDGIERQVNISLVDVKKGNYVIVHAGFAIQKLTSKDTKDISDLLKEK
ncbi:MAG: HypC/HybG/HupF family hydrogenase formation chaperone [Candidatus Pacebacteria bacterium]|nr:HypC/HybG/HupF family hydrogenase formation chaperone [Candidatus Paceibacterota bacterium]